MDQTLAEIRKDLQQCRQQIEGLRRLVLAGERRRQRRHSELLAAFDRHAELLGGLGDDPADWWRRPS